MGKNERDIQYLEDNSTLVGKRKRELVDTDTGEIMKVEQITKLVYGSKNFWKCYLKEFLGVLKTLEGKQLQVLVYIIENTRPSTNEFTGTYKHIIKGAGCCRQTVADTMTKLQKCNFITKKCTGVWIVNPDILMKGNDRKRHMLLTDYKKAKTKDIENENTNKKIDKVVH